MVLHHGVGRKVSHLTEYALLALLWFRALVARGSWTPRWAAWTAFSVIVAS